MTAGLAQPLDRLAMEILEFERSITVTDGRKDHAILERFACSPTRYHQRLQQTLDLPAAEVYDPELVRRRRRLRDRRAAARGARRSGWALP